MVALFKTIFYPWSQKVRPFFKMNLFYATKVLLVKIY